MNASLNRIKIIPFLIALGWVLYMVLLCTPLQPSAYCRFGSRKVDLTLHRQALLERVDRSRNQLKQLQGHRHIQPGLKQRLAKVWERTWKVGTIVLSGGLFTYSFGLIIQDQERNPRSNSAALVQERQMRQYDQHVIQPLKHLVDMAQEGRPLSDMTSQMHAFAQALAIVLERSKVPEEQTLGQRLRFNLQLHQDSIYQASMDLVRLLREPQPANTLPNIEGFTQQHPLFQNLSTLEKDRLSNQIIQLYQSTQRENGSIKLTQSQFMELQSMLTKYTLPTLHGVTPAELAQVQTQEEVLQVYEKIVTHPQNFSDLTASERLALKEKGKEFIRAIGFEYYQQPGFGMMLLLGLLFAGSCVGSIFFLISFGIPLTEEIQGWLRKNRLSQLKKRLQTSPPQINLTEVSAAERPDLEVLQRTIQEKCSNLAHLRKQAAQEHPEFAEFHHALYALPWTYTGQGLATLYENRLHQVLLGEQKSNKTALALSRLDFYRQLDAMIDDDLSHHRFLPEVLERDLNTPLDQLNGHSLELAALQQKTFRSYIQYMNQLVNQTAARLETEKAHEALLALKKEQSDDLPTDQLHFQLAQHKHQAAETKHRSAQTLTKASKDHLETLEKEAFALQLKWIEQLSETDRQEGLQQLARLQQELEQNRQQVRPIALTTTQPQKDLLAEEIAQSQPVRFQIKQAK